MSTNSVTAEPEFMPAKATSTTDKPKRYHPALVTLHWLIAILIFGAFFLAQGNGGDRGRFRPGQGNFPQQGQGFQQGNPPTGNFQQGNQSQQGFPQGGFPPQRGNQSIFSAIGIHMIFGIIILVLLGRRSDSFRAVPAYFCHGHYWHHSGRPARYVGADVWDWKCPNSRKFRKRRLQFGFIPWRHMDFIAVTHFVACWRGVIPSIHSQG